MQPQFLSRFDNAIILEDLDASLLARIFIEPADSVFKTSQRFFKKYSIDLEITDDAVLRVAEAAAEQRRIGARALKEVYGRVIKPFEYDPFAQEEVQKNGKRHRFLLDVDTVLRGLSPSV